MSFWDNKLGMEIIARIKTDFPTKFGVPRQAGLVSGLMSEITFEPKYRSMDCIKGLEEYSHIWLLWQFTQAKRGDISLTVRPPRLGGNTHVGVFATRSPFRPNGIALSCVRLERIESGGKRGPVLFVSGADMTDGTPILDIKPYLPFTDSHPEASGGFADRVKAYALEVDCPKELLAKIPEGLRQPLCEILAQDPRPSYQNDPQRVYGFEFSDFEVKFTVNDMRLRVCGIETRKK